MGPKTEKDLCKIYIAYFPLNTDLVLVLYYWPYLSQTLPKPDRCLLAHRGRHEQARDLGGRVVKAFASRTRDPGFGSRLRRDFSGSSQTSDFKIGTPVTTLPGACRYRVSTGTGRTGFGIL